MPTERLGRVATAGELVGRVLEELAKRAKEAEEREQREPAADMPSWSTANLPMD